MVHEDYKEMIPARALSALDAAEERALNEHLENCDECRKELEEWQGTAATLAVVADPVEPSPKVRERILSEVRKELATPEVIPFRSTSRNVWRSFGSLGAMAAVVLFTALIVGLVVLWRENRAINEELAKTREFIEMATTPGAKVNELKGIDLGAGATASLAYDKSGRAMLMAEKLPSVPRGKVYQLWFIVGKNPPMPGKTFSPDDHGGGMLKDQMPKEALDSAIFAITVEPEGGSDAPTSPVYLRSFEVN
ncbi:MAG TPA: anti-sigma factor [Pyrinomonadaceae bacterium]|jgi:anti-sigma-K factor RskA|nr:anti-sigma factor [Pyrinomonadaceae bacterium]